MTKNPLVNAAAAALYIAAIALIMFFGNKHAGPANSVVGPIAVISLFTLSAAVMGCLFLYQPFHLYIEGKMGLAVDLFLKTVAVFAIITVLMLALFFSGILF